jgi:hypothetical protein
MVAEHKRKLRMYRSRLVSFTAWLIAVCLLPAFTAYGQNASLRGQVKDETGAVIPGVKVTATSEAGKALSAVSAGDGSYRLAAMPNGTYQVEAKAAGFRMKTPAEFVGRGQDGTLNLVLTVSEVVQQYTVQADAASSVSVESSNNAGALVLSGEKLDSLSDNPDDLASDLQALAGPSAGPNGGQFYIDGFSTGEMPPKESIREIRVNQNPFSPEYDSLGVGRIEIFTKPGSDKFHGTASFNLGMAEFNSRNPYAAAKAPFLLREFGISLAGPLNHRASFTLDGRGEATDNGAIINGSILDPTSFAIVSPYSSTYSVAQQMIMVSPHVDYQLSKNNTASIRYRVQQGDIPFSGLGSFNLVESAYHAHSLSQTTQVVETAVLNDNAVTETRFQYFDTSSSTVPVNSGYSVLVQSAFTGGGSTTGNSSDVTRNYELQNISTVTRGADVWHFGVRLRATAEQNVSRQNFNGTFTFAGETAPELDASNQPVKDASGNTILIPITSIEQYRRTLIHAPGGGASQFSQSAGNPAISGSQVDAGLFVENTWKIQPNLTLDMGLRYETQNNIRDHGDFAPRVGVAWSPKWSQQKLVLRGGYGLFYTRFGLGNTLNSLRYNGVTQQQFVVNNPGSYPAIPSAASLAAAGQVIQRTDPNLRAPYLMQTMVSVERQLPLHTVLSVSYSNSRGLHQFHSVDLNAPPTPGGPYPMGNSNPVFQAESSGVYNQNLLIANVTAQITRDTSLFGSYTYGKTLSNTDGLGTFPANPYSMVGEYGPASTDVRNFETFGGTIQAFWKTTWSPLLTMKSGPPFNITAGRDLYGTTLFNGRPGIAIDPSRPGVIQTSYGLLDPSPMAGETILPRNFGRGPGSVQFNLRFSKTMGFGSVKGAPEGKQESRYGLVLTLQMRNLLNHNNPGPIIGNIASPLFGRANQAAGSSAQSGTNFSENATNRRFEGQMRFTF